MQVAGVAGPTTIEPAPSAGGPPIDSWRMFVVVVDVVDDDDDDDVVVVVVDVDDVDVVVLFSKL